MYTNETERSLSRRPTRLLLPSCACASFAGHGWEETGERDGEVPKRKMFIEVYESTSIVVLVG